VTTILVTSDVLPLAEVKAKFSEMVDRVEHQHDRITVTRNGRPAAVLMSTDALAALEDTLARPDGPRPPWTALVAVLSTISQESERAMVDRYAN